MSYNQVDPFSICFNMMKMRYVDYDESLTQKNFLAPTDKVNLFINLETVYKFLSMVTDLERRIISEREFNQIMISNIINLAGHYKRFFNNNGLATKVFLYSTDLSSNEFNQYKYNEDYRSYYLNKFNENPKFILFTERMINDIIPEVRTLIEFIPDIYFITGKNIEGSLIPYIIALCDKSRKNLIIGGELYDTQYSTIPNFINHYFCKKNKVRHVESDVNGYIQLLTSTPTPETDLKNEEKIYNNYSLYTTLISVLGNRERSIDKISGVGLKTLTNYINAGIDQHIITQSTLSPEILGDLFHDADIKQEFVSNYYCSNFVNMYDELSEGEKTSVYNQIRDRSDINSIERINATRFYHHPIILEGLF